MLSQNLHELKVANNVDPISSIADYKLVSVLNDHMHSMFARYAKQTDSDSKVLAAHYLQQDHMERGRILAFMTDPKFVKWSATKEGADYLDDYFACSHQSASSIANNAKKSGNPMFCKWKPAPTKVVVLLI